MSHIPRYLRDNARVLTQGFIVALVFAGLGYAAMHASHAATYATSGEAENGTVAGCANTTSDGSASNGQAVKFGGCDTSDPTNLDASGTTVPDTAYAIPSGAVFMATNGSDSNTGTQASPVKTLAKAMSIVPISGTVVVRGGTYRDGSTTSITKTFTLQAYPHEQVWFDGTDIVSSWTSIGGGQWYTDWTTTNFCGGHYYDLAYNQQTSTGPCAYADEYGDASNPAAGDPQMVFQDGTYIHEVTSQAAATGNNFYYDQTNKRLYIGFDPSGHTVELASRPNALVFQGGSGGDVVRGIGFKRFASSEYAGYATNGAILANAPNVTLEDDVITLSAGNGVTFANATGGVVKSTVLAKNGANGLDANGHQHSSGIADNIDIENNVFNANNTERFGPGCSASCSAAGSKIAHMDGFTLKNNIFENGVVAKGFWCDLACSNGVMVDNVFKNNDGAGLMYEVSDTGIIASNLIYGNGAEGLKMGSSNTKIYNNTIVNNAVNVLIYDDNRSYGVGGWTDVGPDTTNVSFMNNVLSGGNTMVEAWRTSATSPNTGPNTFFSGLDYNSYYRTNGGSQVLFNWKESSTTNYTSLSSLTGDHSWENHGQDISSGADPFFVNAASNNYAVRSDSNAYHSGTALPADVAAALGLSTGTIVSRGVIQWPGQ